MTDIKKTARKIFPNGKVIREAGRILIVQDEKDNEWLFYREYTGFIVMKCYSIKE